jgi:hypothetical protein
MATTHNILTAQSSYSLYFHCASRSPLPYERKYRNSDLKVVIGLYLDSKLTPDRILCAYYTNWNSTPSCQTGLHKDLLTHTPCSLLYHHPTVTLTNTSQYAKIAHANHGVNDINRTISTVIHTSHKDILSSTSQYFPPPRTIWSSRKHLEQHKSLWGNTNHLIKKQSATPKVIHATSQKWPICQHSHSDQPKYTSPTPSSRKESQTESRKYTQSIQSRKPNSPANSSKAKEWQIYTLKLSQSTAKPNSIRMVDET